MDAIQSGYKTMSSTETALQAVIKPDNTKSSVLIFLDLSAVFDTVNHHMFNYNIADMGMEKNTPFHY